MAGGQPMSQQMGQMPQQMGQMGNNMYQMQQQQAQQQQQQRPQNMQISEQQKMQAYQMRLQQQIQGNMQMQAHMQAQQMGRGMVPKQQMQGMANGQIPQGQPGMMRRPMPMPNPETFMKNLSALMAARGLPLDTNPMVGDRPISLAMLFQVVQSKGGYKPVTAQNGWAYMAQALGLPAQNPTVPPTLKQIYERNLAKFEEVWYAQQKQRMMQQQAQQQAQQQPQPQSSAQQVQQGKLQRQNPQMNQGQIQPSQQQPVQQQTPVKPPFPMSGFQTPQAQRPSANAAAPGHNRDSLSRGLEVPAQSECSAPSPAHSKSGSISVAPAEGRPSVSVGPEPVIPRMLPKSDDYTPCSRQLATYGGIDLPGTNSLAIELSRWEPDVPSLPELGNIDIHALTRGLQSGIHGEVRLALDVLAAISNSPVQQHLLQLRFCDDLIDALVDCAEEQLDLLAEHTVEVSDEIQITPYEEVVRACRLEQWAIKDGTVLGTTEYELDRAVDRLICITTILRNISFPGEQNENHFFLADESVVKFLCVIIRYIGTRTMLLRTHNNTLDFMKDAVTLLSNISSTIEIPGREQALCLLQFLLAFAPAPGPVQTDDALTFTPYEPSLHTYLPHAVDALAKLFARDEPNRTHYKTIFALDATNNPPFELLNRAFALAVSPIPDRLAEQKRPPHFPPLVETRKAFLMQGLLSAEILASLAPGVESGVTKAWLSPQSGLAQSLMVLIQRLSRQYEFPINRARAPVRKDAELVYIAVTAVSLLRRLAEKARDPVDASVLATISLPSSQALLEATSLSSPEWTKEGLLQHLTACYNIGR